MLDKFEEHEIDLGCLLVLLILKHHLGPVDFLLIALFWSGKALILQVDHGACDNLHILQNNVVIGDDLLNLAFFIFK